MYFTQEQVDTIQLPIRGKRLKLEVLNTDFQTLATLEGIATGGSLAKDATNFVRRSGSIQMCVPNVASANTFIDYVEGITINVNGKIWLDKYVKIWTGIDNYEQPYGEEPKTVWYNFGICLIDQPVRAFSSEGYTMSFNLIDLAAKMNGDRSGQLAVTTTIFPRISGYDGNGKPIYTKTENALAACIEELTEFKRYTIYPIPEKWATLPYDIKMDVGSTIYIALEQFLNILNGWQMYFDNEGVFTVEPIPSGANDIVYPFNLQLNVSDTNSVDFNNVRNQVIVYGRSHNIDFYSENVTFEAQSGYGYPVLTITYSEEAATKIMSSSNIGSTIFGFKAIYGEWINASTDVWYVTLQYTDAQNNNVIFVDHMKMREYQDEYIHFMKDKIYVFRIKEATVNTSNDFKPIDFTQPIIFELLGRQQSQACMVNANMESPYYIGRQYMKKTYYGEIIYITEHQNYIYYRVDIQGNISDFPQIIGENVLFYFPLSTEKTIRLEIKGYNTSYAVFTILDEDTSRYGGDYTIYAFKINYDYSLNQLQLIPLGRCPYANTLIESGGEFDNIYADSLARERAEYDLFLRSNMQNTITLGCVPDYALDVNYRIKYNQSSALPPDAVIDESIEDKYFITKQVTYPLGLDGSPQTVNAIEIYDDFNYVGYAYDLPTGT